jgi:SMC interacting uncharacterized protein involved in chromosome segregation
MKKKDLEYLKEALEYALNDYTPSQQMQETHFNTFMNAIELVDAEINLLNIDSVSNCSCISRDTLTPEARKMFDDIDKALERKK